MRIAPRFTIAAVGVLVAAACGSHGGFVGASAGVNTGSALQTNAEEIATSIPLVRNSGNKSGFHVRISVAGTKRQNFLFDTGSGGLWVYENAIAHPKNAVRDLHIEAQNKYGSGLEYDGEVVATTVDFGKGLSAANLPLVRVDKAFCTTTSCTKTYGSGKNIIDKLEKDRGLWGTMGADLQPRPLSKNGHEADLYNALFALGSTWTRFGITPSAIDASPSLRGFAKIRMSAGPATHKPLPNGAKSWMRDVSVCYTIGGPSSYSACIATLFDTGADGVDFKTAATLSTQATKLCGRILTSGTRFTASTSGTHGAILAEFKAGTTQNWNEVKVATPAPSSSPQVNTGLTFYNRNEIVFDAVKGVVGLKPLDPPVHNFQSDCDAGQEGTL